MRLADFDDACSSMESPQLPEESEKTNQKELSSGDEDAGRKRMRRDSPRDNSSRISCMKKTVDDQVQNLHGAQHYELSPNAYTKKRSASETLETGQNLFAANVPQASDTTVYSHGIPSVESMPTRNASGAGLDGHEVEEKQEDARDTAHDRTQAVRSSEDLIKFNSHEKDKSGIELSLTPDNQTEAAPHKETTHDMTGEDLHKGHSDIDQRLTTYVLPECYAVAQNSTAVLSSETGQVYQPASFCEAIFANGQSGGFKEPNEFAFMGFSDPPATQQPKMDKKEDTMMDLGHNTDKISKKTENMAKVKSADDAATAFAREEACVYTQPRESHSKISLECTAENNQTENSSRKLSSLFSRSSHYSLQASYSKNVALGLRFGSAIFSLIVFSVIISTTEKRIAAGSTFVVTFSDYQAYNYLAALNLLTFLYSSGQLFLLANGKPKRILSSRLKWGISLYLCDQLLAFLMMSSSSSAATAAQLSWNGLHNIWPPACSTWKLSLFCTRVDVAVGMSFVSCVLLFLSTLSSGCLLSKLLAE